MGIHTRQDPLCHHPSTLTMSATSRTANRLSRLVTLECVHHSQIRTRLDLLCLVLAAAKQTLSSSWKYARPSVVWLVFQTPFQRFVSVSTQTALPPMIAVACNCIASIRHSEVC